MVGRENNNWTNFIQYPVSTIVGGSTHHLKVTTSGKAILVDLDGQRVVSANDATNALPAAFQSGSFGVRRFGVGASFSNITMVTSQASTSSAGEPTDFAPASTSDFVFATFRFQTLTSCPTDISR